MKQGIIKSIPVKEVTEGMQVIHDKSVITLDKNYIKTGYLSDGRYALVAELKTLVVEYEIDGEEQWSDEGGAFISTIRKQLPLKYSQWQSAIDNGEVDSDKAVEFEIYSQTHYQYHIDSTIELARIIPQRAINFREKYKDLWKKEVFIQQFNTISDLRIYLLNHPDKEMVRSSCLHYLGDKFQEFDKKRMYTEEEVKKIAIDFYNTGYDETKWSSKEDQFDKWFNQYVKMTSIGDNPDK